MIEGRAVAQSVTRLAYSHATLAVLSLASGAWVRSLAPAGDNCPFIPWIRIFALIIPSFGGDAKRRSSVYTHAEHRTHYKDPMAIFRKSRHGTPVVHGNTTKSTFTVGGSGAVMATTSPREAARVSRKGVIVL